MVGLHLCFFCLFALCAGITTMANSTFRGSSRTVKNFLAGVGFSGLIVGLAVLLINFFIMPWWQAVLVIIGYAVLLGPICVRLNKIPYLGLITPFLTIIFGALMVSHLYNILGS